MKYTNMAMPMMLPHGSVDRSHNAKHKKMPLKNHQEICVFIVLFDMVTESMGFMGMAWRQTR